MQPVHTHRILSSKALGYAEGKDLQGKIQNILQHTSIVSVCGIGIEG